MNNNRSRLDVSRHSEVFNPVENDPVIHIIGAGATGSHVVYHLVKLGLSNIRVYDFDKVENHNLANQFFFPANVGENKATVIAGLLNGLMGQELIVGYDRKIEKESDLDLKSPSDIVFLLTDTIESRKKIVAELELSDKVSLVIETRMAVSHHETYTFKPSNPTAVAAWVDSLPDEDVYVEVSACGSSLSVGATADNLATTAVWQMVHALNNPESVDFKRAYSLRDGSSSYTASLTPQTPKVLV